MCMRKAAIMRRKAVVLREAVPEIIKNPTHTRIKSNELNTGLIFSTCVKVKLLRKLLPFLTSTNSFHRLPSLIRHRNYLPTAARRPN